MPRCCINRQKASFNTFYQTFETCYFAQHCHTPGYVLEQSWIKIVSRIAKTTKCLITLIDIDLKGVKTPMEFLQIQYGTSPWSKKLSPLRQALYSFIHKTRWSSNHNQLTRQNFKIFPMLIL